MRNARYGKVVLTLALVALSGCASYGGGGLSDEEMISNLVADSMTALKAGDIDGMLVSYASDYQSDQGSLDDQRSFLEGAKEQGFLDDIATNTDAMEIAVDGNSATAGPVDLEGVFGTLSVTYELEKRDGKWLIVSGVQG